MTTYRVALTMASRNVKTGPIPVSTTESSTCAEDCPFREGACYARTGPIRMFWDRLDRGEVGMDWDAFCGKIEDLPEGMIWRHNQAGDLPGDGEIIDREALMKLARANYWRKGFTYTHYPMWLDWNAACVEAANRMGFTVNVSANSLEHADQLKATVNAPVVVVLPRDFPEKGGFTPAGHWVVACPAQTREDVNCMTCRLCANGRRKTIIGFLAHGSRAKTAEAIAKGERP